jgi:hypothetical protein
MKDESRRYTDPRKRKPQDGVNFKDSEILPTRGTQTYPSLSRNSPTTSFRHQQILYAFQNSASPIRQVRRRIIRLLRTLMKSLGES